MPGHIIKQYRELKNYSQKFVASRMGISQNAYSKIENNITQLTVHHVKELSRILEVPITDLLKDDFEIHRPSAMTPKRKTRKAKKKSRNLQQIRIERHLLHTDLPAHIIFPKPLLFPIRCCTAKPLRPILPVKIRQHSFFI